MNAQYENTLLLVFGKLKRVCELENEREEGFLTGAEYLKSYGILLPELKRIGVIKGFEMSPKVSIEWSLLQDLKSLHPTVRGPNPNINIMTAMGSVFENFGKGYDVAVAGTENDPWAMLPFRQGARDILEFFKMSEIIKGYSLHPNMTVQMQDPMHYLSKKQIEKLAQNKGTDPGLSR